MIVAGLVGGYLIIWTGYQLGPNSDQPNFTPPVLFLAAVVALTGIGTFLWTPNGPPPKPREGRSWVTIGFQTFGRDILRERSYVFLLGSRFFILMAAGFFMNLNVFFLADVFGMGPDDRDKWVLIGLVVTAVATGIGTLPGARLSDVVGRKPVIYASAVMGAVGMALLALAPVPEVVIVGIGIVGLASGAFLSVDWALMTDIIPKASSGRYMGISNVATATSGIVATMTGGVLMDNVNHLLGYGQGPRYAFALAVGYFVLGAILLRPVVEPKRAAVAS
jgi:MFS family permease